MYVNTLITLQENLSTYGLDGNKVTGHVTLNSPGLIKCYVQNLKKSTSGQAYVLYVFNKAKDKGVRIGELSSNKETKWMVEAKDIGGSGITLDEVDGVAIVSEDNLRGADTILMGFKNNRYMIIPLIDQIFKKRTSAKLPNQGNSGNPLPKSQKPEGSGNPPPRPQKPEGPENPPPRPQKPEGLGNPPPRPQKPEGLGNPSPRPQKPEGLGNPPPRPQKPEGLGNPPPRPQMSGGPENPPPSHQKLEGLNPLPSPPLPKGPENPPPSPKMSGSPGNLPPRPPKPEGLEKPPFNVQNEHMVESDTLPNDSGPSVLKQGSSVQENQMPGVVMPNQVNQISQEPESVTSNEVDQELQGAGPVTLNQSMPEKQEINENPPKAEYEKVKILNETSKRAEAAENIDAVNISVAKIAEILKEIETEASLKKQRHSEISSTSINIPTVPVVIGEDKGDQEREKREEEKMLIHKKVTQELQRIINMLRENKEDKRKNKRVEEQIEKICKLPQSHKLTEKSSVEKTLESRYMEQKIDGVNDAESAEKIVGDDTTPKKALNFILKRQDEIATTKKIDENRVKDNKENEKQQEIDYISEIDKKIKEIEAKRNQEKY